MAKSFVGTVVSDKADKTITVSVLTRKTHPIYKKQYTQTKKFMAHDEANEARQGDKVSIAETRPLSRRKRFTLRRVIERAAIRHEENEPAELEEIKRITAVNKLKAVSSKTAGSKSEEKS